LALSVGVALASPVAQGRLSFEVARLLAWAAAGATVGAFLTGAEVPAFFVAIATDGGGEDIRELRRRVTKPLPRKVRKEIERIAAEQIRDLPRAASEWHGEEQRWADRVGFLLSRDATAALETIAGATGDGGGGAKRSMADRVRTTPRALDLVRYLATEGCWRTYVRLTA